MIRNGKVVHDPKAYNELADRWAQAIYVPNTTTSPETRGGVYVILPKE
jgi:hypothetical protein